MAQLPMMPQFYMGKGIDSTTGKSFGQAIDFDEGPPLNTGQIKSMRLDAISGSLELADKLEVGTNISMMALNTGVSAEFKLAKSLQVNNFFTYALIKVLVQNPPRVLRSPRLKPQAKELLEAKGWEEFFHVYGPEYIEAEITGGHYFALIEIQTNSEEQKRDVGAKLSGHYKIFNSGVELSNDLKEVSKRYTLKIEISQSGGSGDPFEATIDEMLEQAKVFPQLVKDSPVVVAVLTNDYRGSVPVPPGISNPDSLPMRSRQETLEDLGKEYLKLRDYRGNLEFVLDHFLEFDDHRELEKPQLDTLKKEYQDDLAATSEELDVVVRHANRCAADYQSCQTYVPKIHPKALPVIGGQTMNLKQVSEKVVYLDQERQRLEAKASYLEDELNKLSRGERKFSPLLDVDGDIRMKPEKTFVSHGRMHIAGDEHLFLLNKTGVTVSKAWGGNGNLTVEGQINGQMAIMTSNDRRFQFVLQDDGNAVLYEAATGKPLWDSWKGNLRR